MRRSETFEQHEYEKKLHDQQFGDSSDDLESDLDKMKIDKDGEGSTKKGGVFTRLKNQIKSSFPEAVQDLKIMGVCLLHRICSITSASLICSIPFAKAGRGSMSTGLFVPIYSDVS